MKSMARHRDLIFKEAFLGYFSENESSIIMCSCGSISWLTMLNKDGALSRNSSCDGCKHNS